MMHQTLFGLAALMGVMFFSYHQQRALLRAQMVKMQQLTQHQAQAEAVEVLDRFEGEQFDPNVPVTSASELSLQDQAGITTINDAASIQDSTIVTSDSLKLTMSGRVQFVEPSGGTFVSAGEATYYKEITIEVSSDLDGIPADVQLSRVYSYVPTP